MIEDKLLIWKLKRGSPDALRQIYEKYKNIMLKLAVILLNDSGLAEDIVQDVFLNFTRLSPTIKPRNLKVYLTVAVINQIRNHIRDRKRRNTTTLDDSDDIVSKLQRPEHWAILSEQLKLLSKAMSGIPYEQREVITLYIQGDKTFRQIAKIQNTSVSTVQGRYRYGIEKLRKLLNHEVEK